MVVHCCVCDNFPLFVDGDKNTVTKFVVCSCILSGSGDQGIVMGLGLAAPTCSVLPVDWADSVPSCLGHLYG